MSTRRVCGRTRGEWVPVVRVPVVRVPVVRVPVVRLVRACMALLLFWSGAGVGDWYQSTAVHLHATCT